MLAAGLGALFWIVVILYGIHFIMSKNDLPKGPQPPSAP